MFFVFVHVIKDGILYLLRIHLSSTVVSFLSIIIMAHITKSKGVCGFKEPTNHSSNVAEKTTQYADYLFSLGHIGNSHNSYLAIWLNVGIIGLSLYFFALIYRFVKASGKSAFAIPLMYCVVFSATFEEWLVGSLNPHTPLLLVMWTMMMTDKKETTVEDKWIDSKYKIPSLIT